MTKEQFKRAKEIEEELLQLGVAVKVVQNAVVGGIDGVAVDLTKPWLKYKMEVLRLFKVRKTALEAELKTL